MTDRIPSSQTGRSDKKVWAQPELRAVVPTSHTRSGPFPNGPQEDAFYRIS